MNLPLPVLYHYYMCPYCIRVRLALGYLKIPYQSRPIPYADEQTPVALTGKKMVPIWQDERGAINESLDIIAYLDKSKQLYRCSDAQVNGLLAKLGDYTETIYCLMMPWAVLNPEFSVEDKKFFIKSKEAKRGPFPQLVAKAEHYKSVLAPFLHHIEASLRPYYEGNQLSLMDIIVAAQLWNLYSVPEFQFAPKVNQYLQNVKRECGFDYLGEAWNNYKL